MTEQPLKEKRQFVISKDDTPLGAVVYETIIARNGIPFKQVWFFEKAYFPCGRCQMPDYIQFRILPTGVYKACKYCGFAEGVSTINSETGEHRAELLEETQISVEDAWAILAKHKSIPYAPFDLPRVKPQRVRRSNVPTI